MFSYCIQVVLQTTLANIWQQNYSNAEIHYCIFTVELIYCHSINIFPLLRCLPQPGERISDLIFFIVDHYLVRCTTAVAFAIAVLFNAK